MKKRPNPRQRELAQHVEPPIERLDEDDEQAEIRYSLTSLGEAVLNDRRGCFRGFGPCAAVA